MVMDQDIQGLSVTHLSEEDAVFINFKVSKIDIFSDVLELRKSFFVAQMQIHIQSSCCHDIGDSIDKRSA